MPSFSLSGGSCLGILALVCAMGLAASGCDNTALYACTEEFRTIQVQVTDAAGAPVEGLAARSVLARTGRPLDLADDLHAGGANGFYTVATDAHLDHLRIDGDVVVFTAEGGGLRAEAQYLLADDGCHVQKDEGPSEIVAVPL